MFVEKRVEIEAVKGERCTGLPGVASKPPYEPQDPCVGLCALTLPSLPG